MLLLFSERSEKIWVCPVRAGEKEMRFNTWMNFSYVDYKETVSHYCFLESYLLKDHVKPQWFQSRRQNFASKLI